LSGNCLQTGIDIRVTSRKLGKYFKILSSIEVDEAKICPFKDLKNLKIL
jgi:hypothetical protein